MNYSTAVFLINKHARAIACTYEAADNSARTTFKTLDPEVKVGDFVVVPTDTRHKMTVCKVVEADVDVDFDSTVQMAWIISRVDRAPHEQILAQEAQAVATIKSGELRKKREDLAKSLLADKVADLKALPITAMNGDHKPADPE